jgi:hypothetical protein
MKFLKFSSILFCVLFFSCNKEDDIVLEDTNSLQSGVVLTFDDDYVEDWKIADTKLKEYS